MADNTILNSGSGGDTIASDDIGGVKYPRSKIVLGSDGTNDGDVSSTNPLPVLLSVSQLSTLTPLSSVSATQSGTWTVQPGNIANTTAWKVDGSAVTQPVSVAAAIAVTDNSGSLTVDNGGTFAVQAAQSGAWNVTNVSGTVSLPTGASTSAKQPAIGTAGSASADVLTVQGIASMTAIKVDGSAVTQPVSIASTVAVTQSGMWTVQPGNTANTTAWKVDGSAVTQPVSLASVPSHAVTNAGTFAVQAVCTNAGTFATQATLQAGTALVGQASASCETSTIYNGTTALTPKYAKITASSSGDNTLVAAVTSKKIRVLAYNFIANGTVNAKFQSGAAGTDLTGLKYCVANSGLSAGFNPLGWFETASNTLLNLNLSAGIAVGGELVYCEV